MRTTFIVGYPGETEDEFQTLLDFVEEMRFDRLGVFTFSFEPGTASEPLGDPVPAGGEGGAPRPADGAAAADLAGEEPGLRRPDPAGAGRGQGDGLSAGPHRTATRPRSTAW